MYKRMIFLDDEIKVFIEDKGEQIYIRNMTDDKYHNSNLKLHYAYIEKLKSLSHLDLNKIYFVKKTKNLFELKKLKETEVNQIKIIGQLLQLDIVQ